ncbi:patronin [Nilaparvata lugens]|uniref:patronin n=1 Tax=Nilaparvata lugens TaxID=108931 RepID=UPI00193D319B|nr:patronin [Nilaparvata lugens]
MWCAISRLFNNQTCQRKSVDEDSQNIVMDRGDSRRTGTPHDGERTDTYDTRQAKHRATVKWLMSKAFNNSVPEQLREPFYRDHEDQEHLKPQLVHLLANAELYCLALGNIYSDPNYHNMNHTGVLQVLLRKGVFVSDTPPTETVLIQTNPLKMSAHVSVMEAVMWLYAKEVATPDRVQAAVQRFPAAPASSAPTAPADNAEQALLTWVRHAVAALSQRIQEETGSESEAEFPKINELADLGDGALLAGLVAFYCPEELSWQSITLSKVPSMTDRLRNLHLLHHFCQHCLPYSVFHMTPEDVCYMRESMKQNLLVFLADLFNVLEIHPAKCVRFDRNSASLTQAYPRNSQGVAHKRCLPQSVSAIPDLRSNLDAHSNFSGLPLSSSGGLKKSHSIHQTEAPPQVDNREETFVVHRGKGIPTLSSIQQQQQQDGGGVGGTMTRAMKEAAGKPSNWEDSRRSSYAGRRSRRNSLSEDSQLTLENFGGSQENLHFLGRNPDKEPAVHVGRRDSSASRSSLNDNKSTNLHNALQQEHNGDTVHIELKKPLSAKLQQQQSQSNSEDVPPSVGVASPAQVKKTTTFATLPPQSTTTWQQQQQQQQQQQKPPLLLPLSTANAADSQSETESADGQGGIMGSQLLNIRLKLEEKRRRIESDKRRMEAVMNRQRQKVGKAAFLQAVTKGQNQTGQKANTKPAEPEALQAINGDLGAENLHPPAETLQRPISLQVSLFNFFFSLYFLFTYLEQHSKAEGAKKASATCRTLGEMQVTIDRKTPDIDSMDLETCQQSIAQYNSSLQEIQQDLQRLSSQQSEMSQHQHQPPQQPSPQPQPPFHQPPLQQQQPPMASFATLHHQNSYASRGAPQPQPQSPQQQMHSLLYNNHAAPNQQWHSLMNQQPNNYHNDYMQQQQQMHNQQNNFINHQQVHSLMNQQPMNSFATMNNHRNYPNSQGGGGFILNQHQPAVNNYGGGGAADVYQPQSHQHHQMNQLMHGDSAGEFYLHDPPTPQRRTWGQPPPMPPQHDAHMPAPAPTWANSHSNHHNSSQPQQPASLSSSPHTGGGFMLHHNGAGGGGGGDGGYKTSPPSLAPTPPPRRAAPPAVTHAPLPTPPVDDMEPQSISFIGADEDELNAGLNRIHITSGSRTYRIPSPTRTHTPISRTSFTQQQQQQPRPTPKSPHGAPPPAATAPTDKGFYISFDDDTPPKRPKPPLRVKRASPKKERALTQVLDALTQQSHNNIPNNNNNEIVSPGRLKEAPSPSPSPMRVPPTTSQLDNDQDGDGSPGVGLIIGSELLNPDPSQLDEMERKKERILLLSLQRRQAQEEAKARKEAEAARRKENEKMKEEERARKKEEEKARRAAILDQYKLKKAIEEAEREGKNVDKDILNSLKMGSSAANMSGGGAPKMRNRTGGGQGAARPRPKTIHIADSGHAHAPDAHDGTLTPSRGKKGSSSNLSVYSSPMRRDYYRGSQDSLAETRRTAGSFNHHTDFGEDSRGASPGRTLGRRGSYKTSRDPSPDRPFATQYGRSRSNSRYGTYQGRRKSNSLMNLSGSSCDQDSLLYRYGDTDSGLGRATPPRRAPSPGQHPPSPSGPGSLPAGSHRRRYGDDTASESGSDYSGPRLYKQPATKSNKGIILNAVEYCVFPGVVNREAKRRVLEEINRSEAKHFLVLFRDAGCQFRALYSYCPDTEEVAKLYGTGPKLVSDRMFDKFFKYNSGGKCFSQVHTKHLTVTIDAFTIHNSLWQGKKVNLPSKRDMVLVI